MSQIEAVALYSGWRFLLKLNGLQPQDQKEKCYYVASSDTESQDWLAMLIFAQHLQEGGMERVSPVQLAFLQTLMA